MYSKLLTDYLYELPESKIALEPCSPRDASKLLYYKDGIMGHYQFYEVPKLIPKHSLLIFNDTKVIPARLKFSKSSGAIIEIFLLNPVDTSIEVALESKSNTSWQTLIGNKKRWVKDEVLQVFVGEHLLMVKLIDSDKNIVEFTWEGSASFSELLIQTGDIPLPPYIPRATKPEDWQNYQTIYAKNQGAVAAPTAGLHFTERVLDELRTNAIEKDYVTLYVGAGTFKPIKHIDDYSHHTMHNEKVIVGLDTVRNIGAQQRFIVAVGTTSLRTLESLYWFGVLLTTNPDADFHINQDLPYSQNYSELPTKEEAFGLIRTYMEKRGLTKISGETKLFIYPSYEFRVCDALITNFHQPGSSLILLVASFVGEDWRKVYNEALSNNYRFLSYGDSSLLYKKKP